MQHVLAKPYYYVLQEITWSSKLNKFSLNFEGVIILRVFNANKLKRTII